MKNNWKKITAFLLCAMLLVSIPALASEQVRATLENVIVDGVTIVLNGETLIPTDANGNPVEPMIYNGTTYLPVRAISNALGLEVAWDQATYTVTLSEPGSSPAPSGQSSPAPTEPAAGSRSNPYSADDGVVVEHNEYSFHPVRQISINSATVIRGEAGKYLASLENSYNTLETGSQEWIFLVLDLSYISSSDGEDDQIDASDIIYTDTFYKPDGSAVPAAAMASLGDIYRGYGVFDVSLYPGGFSPVVIGLKSDKSVEDILLRVPNSGGDKNSWIKCNSDTNVITTIDELTAMLDLVDEESNENSPIKISLTTSLPTTISSYDYSDDIESSAAITGFEYKADGARVDISFIGEKTYDIEGSGQSRQVKVGWKLYDEEGYVVESGTARSTSIKEGEKFKNCEATVYGLEPGNYTMEIMSVN